MILRVRIWVIGGGLGALAATAVVLALDLPLTYLAAIPVVIALLIPSVAFSQWLGGGPGR